MYLLFIQYASGLCHNAAYPDIRTAYHSILQLIDEENQANDFLSLPNLQECLKENDDFTFQLNNKTWFHLQPFPIFSI